MKENIFKNIPENLPDEIFNNLLVTNAFRIERIVSKGQCSPKDFLYDQNENEWLIVLQGSAKLSFENTASIELEKGDYLNIPAHQKHRVERTDPHQETVWLAIFY